MEYTKILFVPTSNAGVSYWRMWNFAKSMYDTKVAETQLFQYDSKRTDLAEWELTLTQARAMGDYTGEYRLTKAIDVLARQANAIIFGLVHSFTGIDVFTSLVEMRKAGHLRDCPILMEIDDNILNVMSQNPAFHTYEPGTELREIAIRQMKAADGMIVSTPYLADLYSDYNKNIFVAPNSIDWKVWGSCKNNPKRGVRIGWAGGKAHDEDLGIIRNVIPEILNKYRDAVFCFVNGAPAYVHELRKQYGNRIEIKPWADVNKYPQMIAGLDWNIALAPLVDSSFNRGKSNLRWLEAGALGIPTIASNVGHFAESIDHRVNGILCDGPDDFSKALSELIENKPFRKHLGKKARQKIFQKFSVDSVSRSYVEWITKRSNELADEPILEAQKKLQERENDQSAIA